MHGPGRRVQTGVEERETILTVRVFTGSLTRPMPQYGAANGEGLRGFDFDPATGRLAARATAPAIDDTGWVLCDAGRGVLYATCEVSGSSQSAVAAYRIGETELVPINQQPTGGNEACHLSLTGDGRHLLVANYNGALHDGRPSGSVAVFPLAEDGSIGAATCVVDHGGSGPHRERQASAHAHCVVPAPSGHLVYVADLGIDQVKVYRLHPDGQLQPQPEVDASLPPGLGPRHLVFSGDGSRLFLVSELIPTVMSFRVDAETGSLVELDRYAIPSPAGGLCQPAGILLHPGQRHLYVGLRLSDEILVLEIGPDGSLTPAGRWPSGGSTPRDFALTPDGRHLIVANQDSDRLSVFAVDAAGALGGPVSQIDVGTPMSVAIAAR